MEIAIKAIGTFITGMGLIYLLKPGVIRTLIQFFAKGRRLYLAAFVRFALAIIFFISAGKCDWMWVIAAFGAIFLLSGLLIFILGLEKARGILNWYLEQPDFIFRILASIVLIVGLLIVYAA